MQGREKRLQDLKQKILKDKTLPLRKGATNLVFGEGNCNGGILILGEAPGKSEDEQGRPFVGAAGKFLDRLLESAGIKREDVWISNTVYFRPPLNRAPSVKEMRVFSPYVDEQIKIVDPKIIITLGRTPLLKFLPNEKITKVHGQEMKMKIDGREVILIPMFHPAAGLRSPEVRKILEEDFKNLPLHKKYRVG